MIYLLFLLLFLIIPISYFSVKKYINDTISNEVRRLNDRIDNNVWNDKLTEEKLTEKIESSFEKAKYENLKQINKEMESLRKDTVAMIKKILSKVENMNPPV